MSDLFKVLAYDRQRLLDYLVVNGSYDALRASFMEVENEHTDIWDIVQRLLLGRYGSESNKQMAIYELPTHELIDSISMICEQLGVFKVEEIAAGTGLLSGMLSRLTNIEVNSTDGKTWMETYVPLYPVQPKLLLEYAMDNVDYDDKLIVISWILNRSVDDLVETIKTKKFRQIIIIGEQFNKYISNTDNALLENGYNRTPVPTKQLCYNDYFKMNSHYPDNCIRSSCILYTRNDVEPINIVINNHPPVVNDTTDYMIIQDMIVFGLLPRWLLNVLVTYDQSVVRKTIIDIERSIANSDSNKHMIFNIIDGLDQFNFWLSKLNFPKITIKEKFVEFYELCKALNYPNGLINLKQKLCFPEWIHSKDEAEKYLYLDFSTSSKRWKESRESFIAYYRSTIGANTYITGSIFGI